MSVLFASIVLAFTAAFIGIAFFMLTRGPKEKRQWTWGVKYISRLRRFSITKKLDTYLESNGRPLGIGGDMLLTINLLSFIVAFLQLLSKDFNTFRLVLIFILLMDAVVISQAERHKKLMIIEFCNIQDIVYFQSKINTPQDVILAYAVQHCNEPLKTPLNELLNKYKYLGGEKDIQKIYEEFRKTSNIMELQSFSFILEQKEINGFSEENHKAQATMLKRAKRLRRKMGREVKRIKLIIAAILLFACYAGFITLPIFRELMNKGNQIFR